MTEIDAPELSCQALVELVTDYLEDRLPPSERARFEAHLGDCPHCRVYLEQMRHTLSHLGHVPEQALSPQARDALLTAFRAWAAG